jgi:hypothetical protein
MDVLSQMKRAGNQAQRGKFEQEQWQQARKSAPYPNATGGRVNIANQYCLTICVLFADVLFTQIASRRVLSAARQSLELNRSQRC